MTKAWLRPPGEHYPLVRSLLLLPSAELEAHPALRELAPAIARAVVHGDTVYRAASGEVLALSDSPAAARANQLHSGLAKREQLAEPLPPPHPLELLQTKKKLKKGKKNKKTKGAKSAPKEDHK